MSLALFGENIGGLMGKLKGPTPTPWEVAFSAAQTAQAESFAATQTAVAGENAVTQTAVALQATQAAEVAQATQTAVAGANAATQTAVALQATQTAQAAQAAATQTAQAGITPILRLSPIIVKPLIVITPGPEVVYDLVAKADKASWQSGAGNLPWPGASNDSRGFARWVDNAALEDNSTAPKVLETHPQWVENGFIQGYFVDIYHSGYTVDVKDYFVATVGLLKNASGGSVTFKVQIRVEGGGNTWIATVSDSYDGSLKTIEVPLSTWAGKRADFILRVEAGSSAGQDWAIRAKARIERR